MVEKVIASRRVFEGRILKLRVDTVLTADGRTSTREIVEHAACVAIIAVDGKGNIVLVRQYRQATGKELLEIPAGGIDPGETPEEAVSREMQEEAGLRPGRVRRLGGFYTTPGFSNEYLYLYLATDLAPGRLQAEDTAGIEVVKMPLAEAISLISSGHIEDAKTIAGLLYYRDYLARNKAQ